MTLSELLERVAPMEYEKLSGYTRKSMKYTEFFLKKIRRG